MARKVVKSSNMGGSGGNPWDDDILGHSPVIVGVHRIDIRHGNQVDGLQVTYRLADGTTYTAPRHGGDGGTLSSFTLASDEGIARIEGKTNNVLVDQVTFVTSNAAGEEKQYGPFGKTGQTPFSVDGYVIGFFGRAGNLLDGIGVYYMPAKKSRTWGGRGGNMFTDPIDSSPVAGIKRMCIRHGNQIDGISVDYQLLGGGTFNGVYHGGSGGSLSTVELAEGEVIIRMNGRTNQALVDQLTFTTRKHDGSTCTYGPFGKTGKITFQVEGNNIFGFYGRAGNLLDALGVYYTTE
jgi:hypothetical protein